MDKKQETQIAFSNALKAVDFLKTFEDWLTDDEEENNDVESKNYDEIE